MPHAYLCRWALLAMLNKLTRRIFRKAVLSIENAYRPVEHELSNIHVPVSVIWEDRDPFFGIEQGKRTAARISRALFRPAGRLRPLLSRGTSGRVCEGGIERRHDERLFFPHNIKRIHRERVSPTRRTISASISPLTIISPLPLEWISPSLLNLLRKCKIREGVVPTRSARVS